MLFVSLLVCFFLVLIGGLTSNRHFWAGCIVVCFVGFCALQMGMAVILSQCAITFFLLLLWDGKRLSKLWFAVNLAPVLLGCIVYGIARWQELDRLRESHPFQSLEARLPKRELSPATNSPDERRFQAELARDLYRNNPMAKYRTENLSGLHDKTLEMFVNSPGFGAARSLRWNPSAWSLEIDEYKEPELHAQRSGRPIVSWSTADLFAVESRRSLGEFEEMHRHSYVDFVFPLGFGYARDRNHAAGFHAHGFSLAESIAPKSRRIMRIDLVSLLLHDPPAVYVSDHLPRMKDVKNVPTRPLSTFEQSGLAAIRNGDVLFAREKNGFLFMIGGIRALKQCTSCHECDEGDLLGAFSYVLH